MKSIGKQFLLFCIILLSVTSAFAATKTWVGAAVGGSWSTASNWSPAVIPGPTDDIVINAGTSAMTFSGMTTQTINTLTINGTSGSVTWSSGASTLTITGNFTSAVDVNTGVIGISTAGTGSNIASSKTLTISSSSSLAIPSGGVFTVNGTLTTTSAATAPISTGAITRLIIPSGGIVNYNCGGFLATMPLMTVQAGGILNITSSNTVILSAISITGKISIASTGSTAISTSGSAPAYQSGSTLEYLNCTAIPENAIAWPTGTSGPTNVTVNSPNGVTITSTSGRQIKGTLTLTSGALILSGSSNTLTFNGTGSVQAIIRTLGTLTTTNSPNISFSPTSPANWSIPAGTYTSAPTFTGFTSAMGAGGSLTMNEQFVTTGTFTLTSGLVTLGTGDLQVATMSAGTPSASKMITTSATSGYLKHSFNTSFSTFLYPIGDLAVTAEYSGFTFTMNSNSTTRVVGFKVVDATHPNINTPTTATNFLSRYWPSTIVPSTGTYDYTMQLPYNGTTGDINGTEANIGVEAWNGSTNWNPYDGSINTTSNYLDISGGTQTTSPLGFDITGRQRDDDECAGATNLGTLATSGCTNGVFNTQGATQSSSGCAGTADDDVWFKFTLPVGYTSVNFTTTTTSGATDLVYQFYSGSCGSLTSKLCSDPEANQVTGLVGGTTYYFRAYTYFSGVSTNSTICLSLPPANDECAGAIPFGTLVTGACANSQNVNTISASQSSTGCAGTADDDVWYSFVLPAGYTSVNFSTINISGSTDRVFQFYSGTCGSLTSITCSDPESGQVSGLTAGVTYYIRAYTYSSGVSSNFTLCLTLGPVNDNCTGAIPFGTLVSGACANSQTVNTLNASQSSTGCAGTADDDVWYSFVLPTGYTSVNFSTVNISGSTDRVFQFYSGTCGSLTSVLCSDPESGQVTGLTAGVTYYIRAYTYSSGVVSNFTLCLTLPPANDNCAGAISMGTLTSGGCNNATFNTFNASQSSTGCAGTADDDVWYSFVMPAGNTSISFSTTNISGSTDLVYQFYSGSCGSLTSLLCSDPETGQLTGLTPGATYYFRVYTYFSGSVTNGTICISLPPSNDDCAGATTLTVNSSCIATAGTTVGATNSGATSYCGSNSDDVWYNFTAPVSTSVAIQVTGTAGFNPALNLRGPATCPAYGSNIICYDYAGTNGTETLKITDLVAGSVYKIRVSQSFLTSGTFNICAASTYTPSGNDNVANALTANIGSTVGNTNSTYGIQLGEPSGSDWSNTGGVDDPTNSQWFKFTPTTTGCYSIVSTGFDTELAIYSASNLSNFNTYIELASDEDNGPAAGYATYTSYISGVTLTAFTTYYIQVSGYPYVSGTPTLIISNPLVAASPVALAATNPGCTGFTANWQASTGSASYQIDVATDAGFTNIVLSTPAGTGTSYAVGGLSGNTTYYYRIRGVNACGVAGSNSGTISVPTTGAVGTPTFTAGATSLCVGGTSTYTATASNSTTISYSIQSVGATIDANTGVVSNVTGNFVVVATAAGTCGSPTTATVSVTIVNSVGTPTFTAGAATLCVGGTSTYTATATDASTITYSIFTGGATINTSTGVISNVTGNFTVRATATGTCGGPTTADFVVSVTPNVGTPVFTAGAATLCVGATSTYTATAANSSTITYSIFTGGATINTSTGVVSSVTGNFTVRATATGTCGGPTTADFVVSVTPNVGTPVFTSGATTLCVGGTSTYTATASNATTVTYSIQSGGATIDANTGVVSNVTADFVVLATATGTCGTPTTATVSVSIVNSVGTPSFTAGASSLCVGGTSTYTATATGASNITYSIFTGGATINASTGVVSSVTGNFTVRATATGNCGGPTTADFVVSVTPSVGIPVFTAGATTLCVGATSTYTATATNSSTITYSIFTGGATINTSTGVVSSVTGNFTVRATATGTCGGPTTADFVVSVTPNVGTPVFTSGATTLCIGGTSTYTATASNSTTVTYSIQSGGATIDANTGVVSNVTGNFVVVATAAGTCGTPTTATVSVTIVNSVGTPTFTAGAATLCVGGTSTYTATATGASTITYSIFTGGASINASTGAVSSVTGNFTVRATATGTCGGPTTADFVVAVSPAQQAAVFTGGPTTLCEGGSANYSVDLQGGVYTIIGGIGCAILNPSTGAVSNVQTCFQGVRYTITGPCGTAFTDFPVTVTPSIGTPSFTAGAATLCVGGTSTYTATATGSSNITYSIFTGGATINASTGAVSSVTGNFTVRATATGACGGPTTADFVVNVTPGVGTPSFTAGASTLCVGGTSTYTATATGASTITYSILTGGATINASTGAVSSVTGSFTVRATATGTCGGPTTADFVVAVNQATAITTQPQAQSACDGGSVTYSVVASGSNLTYQWYYNGNIINNATSSSYTINPVSQLNTGNYTVTVSGTCGNVPSATAALAVNASLSITQQPLTQTTCENDTITLSVATNVNAQYQWQLNSNNINNATSANYTLNGVTLLQAGTYSVNITSACGNATSNNAVLTIVPNITNTKNISICNGSEFLFGTQSLTESGTYVGTFPASNGCDSIVTLNLTVTGPTATINLANGTNLSTDVFNGYQWLLNGNPISGAIGQNYNAIANGQYSVVVTDAGGCTDTSDIITVTAVSVYENAQNYNLGIYPNPATTTVYLKGENMPAGKLTYTLYDVTGRVLEQDVLPTVNGIINQQVDISVYAPGVYMLTINNAKGHVQTFRVVRAE